MYNKIKNILYNIIFYTVENIVYNLGNTYAYKLYRFLDVEIST